MLDSRQPDRAAIEQNQFVLLQQLLADLIPSNAFYRQKFEAANLSPRVESLSDFAKRFPFTTKAELVADHAAHPPFGSNLTCPLDRYTRFHQTSGTTGLPLRWLDTPESWGAMVESWAEVFRAAEVSEKDIIYFAFSFGPFLGFWLAFDAGQKIGALCIPGGSLSSEGRVKAILDNKATVLCCTPTYALRLAEVAARDRVDLSASRLRRIMVAGEPGGSIPAVRRRLEEAWPGAKVFDHHGMTEVGPVTHECPAEAGVLHVMESAYFAEVIDPKTAQAVQPGAQGELVLTTLTRMGAPLLRYRTGDLVQARPPGMCRCGRATLGLEGGIIGRADDMLIIRGVNVHPSAVEAVVREFAGVTAFQGVIRNGGGGLPELRVRVEAANKSDAATLPGKIESRLKLAFGLRIPVEGVAAGSLPRFEMKARNWVTENG